MPFSHNGDALVGRWTLTPLRRESESPRLQQGLESLCLRTISLTERIRWSTKRGNKMESHIIRDLLWQTGFGKPKFLWKDWNRNAASCWQGWTGSVTRYWKQSKASGLVVTKTTSPKAPLKPTTRIWQMILTLTCPALLLTSPMPGSWKNGFCSSAKQLTWQEN